MADIDHDHGRSCGFLLALDYFQVVFHQHKITNPVIDLRILDRFGHRNLVQRIAELEIADIAGKLVACAQMRRVMVTAGFRPFQFTKYLIQCAFSDAFLRFRRHNEPALPFLLFFGHITLLFEVFEEIADPVRIVGQVILAIELAQPRHCL